jgi:hypothetical protein
MSGGCASSQDAADRPNRISAYLWNPARGEGPAPISGTRSSSLAPGFTLSPATTLAIGLAIRPPG